MASPEYDEIRAYFSLYPGRSLMSDHSRAVLYSLVRMMRPQLVAERQNRLTVLGGIMIGVRSPERRWAAAVIVVRHEPVEQPTAERLALDAPPLATRVVVHLMVLTASLHDAFKPTLLVLM